MAQGHLALFYVCCKLIYISKVTVVIVKTDSKNKDIKFMCCKTFWPQISSLLCWQDETILTKVWSFKKLNLSAENLAWFSNSYIIIGIRKNMMCPNVTIQSDRVILLCLWEHTIKFFSQNKSVNGMVVWMTRSLLCWWN